MSKNAIITGATGMIGRALTADLIAHGYHVFAIIRPDTMKGADIESCDQLTVVRGDLSNLGEAVAQIETPCDVFFHLGWAGTFGRIRDDAEVQYANIGYTLDAVRAAAQTGCGVFVGAGSQAEYGRVEGDLAPATPTCPESGYGIAKLCAGGLSRLLCSQMGIKHVWTRILSVYGPYDGSDTMVMYAIDSLLDGRTPEFTPSEQVWDYLYCDDAANALRLAAEKGHDKAIYCLGSGSAHPLADCIRTIRDTIDPNLPVGIGVRPYSMNQVMYLKADISDLMADTGFSPAVGFENGIAQTVAWRRACRMRGK